MRRKILNHPPLNNQRTAAYFLSLGHYDSLMLKLGRVFRERRTALQRALNNVRGVPMEISPEVGGTTYWVRTPRDFDVANLTREAEKHGILIEPVEHYYANVASAEKFEQLQDESGFLIWAREIARREILAFRKRSRRNPVAVDPTTCRQASRHRGFCNSAINFSASECWSTAM